MRGFTKVNCVKHFLFRLFASPSCIISSETLLTNWTFKKGLIPPIKLFMAGFGTRYWYTVSAQVYLFFSYIRDGPSIQINAT